MNALQRIIKRIEEDVQWKIREYEEKAMKDIEEIRKKEMERWEKERGKIERDGRREAEEIKQMHLSKAHLEGRKLLMQAREKIMRETTEEMKKRAREFLGDKYEEYLRKSMEDSKRVFGEAFRVICLKDDISKVKDIAKNMNLRVEVIPGEVKGGGIVAISRDSLKRADYSIEAFIGRNLSEIRRRIYEMLFGEKYA